MTVTAPSATASEPVTADGSPSGAVLTYALAGTVLLAVGAMLLLLAAAQSVAPGLLTVGASTAVGRIRPAALILLSYGGLGMLGSALALEVARRLAGVPVQLEKLARVAGAVTTFGVLGSAVAVLTGRSTGRVGFEMPRGLAAVLALGQLLLLGAVLRTVAKRTVEDLHPALWFTIASLLCAPLVILGGALPVVRGVNDEIVLAFGHSGLRLLWLVPLGIGIALYAVPAASRAPLHSRQLAAVGFWGWFALAPFAGPVRLLSGPAQEWLETAGVAASIALVVPVLALVLLVLGTYTRRTSLAHGAGLRAGLAGTGLLALWAILGTTAATRTAGDFLHASVFADGLDELALYGGAGALLLAGLFHCLPGITGHGIANARICASAVWLLTLGVLLVALALLAAGYVEGVLWAESVRTGGTSFTGAGWASVSDATRPLLWVRVAGEALIALGWVAAFQQVFSTSASGERVT